MSERDIQVFQENQENIISLINECREELYEFLSNSFDEETNQLFDVSEDSSLTELCLKSMHIQSIFHNNAVIPLEPTLINSTTLYAKQKTIYNKIQYCNNILRYSLRKKGIDFGYIDENNVGCNKTRYLIRYLATLKSFQKYDFYVSNISFSQEKDLLVDKIVFEELSSTPVVTNVLIDENDDLIVTTENAGGSNYNNILLDFSLDENGDLIYTRVSDME